MTEHVQIAMQSTQSTDGETETMEALYFGKYRSLPNFDAILYQEFSPEDTSHTANSSNNILKIGPQSVSLTKKGAITTELFFQNNTRRRCAYQTPYGIFDMTIHTSDLHIIQTDDQIQIRIQYALECSGAHISDHTMQINIGPDISPHLS